MSTEGDNTILVVGGGLAGASAARTLAESGWDGEVLLVGAEPHPPYDRPPLSKQVLVDGMQLDLLALPGLPEEIDVRLGSAVASLDAGRRRVRLEDGSELAFRGAVLATGSVARRLPSLPASAPSLRTIGDATWLRDTLLGARRIGIVGAGFVGAEVASSARALGKDVVLIELEDQPLERALGEGVGAWLAERHREQGVDLRTGEEIVEARPLAAGHALRLSIGDTVEVDALVQAVGSVPCVDWLADSGLQIAGGLLCNANLRAAPGIYGAGDIVRWPLPRYGEVRVEHWTTAREHGAHAARNLLAELTGEGEARPYEKVPYFWSDQAGIKLQVAGIPAGAEEVEVWGGPALLWACYRAGDEVVAIAAADLARPFARMRQGLAAGVPWSARLDFLGPDTLRGLSPMVYYRRQLAR